MRATNKKECLHEWNNRCTCSLKGSGEEEDLFDPPRQEESDEAEPLSMEGVSVSSEGRRDTSQEAHGDQVETGGGMRILRVCDRSRENGSAKERPCP